jgi:hypothetical protein
MIRISGPDAIKYFAQAHLADEVLTDDDAKMAGEDVQEMGQQLNSAKQHPVLGKLFEQNPGKYEGEFKVNSNLYQGPQYKINTGTESEPNYVSKLQIEENGKSGLLAIEPKDVDGMFDFSIDVESMTVNADEERKQARQAAVSLLSTNPNVTQMLAAEGVKPKFKELFINWLEDLGFNDAERFFEKVPAASGQKPEELLAALQGKAAQGAGAQANTQTSSSSAGGIPGGTNPNAGGETQQGSPFTGQPLGPASPKAVENLG